MQQSDLFGAPRSALPPGLKYEPRLLDPEEAALLVAKIAPLPFKAFEFHGFTGKRRVVSYGWKYDFSAQRIVPIEAIPDFLRPVRERAAAFAMLDARALEQVLVTEYPPGASIGWHKDKGVFDQVVGVSLGSICTMRFRKPAGGKWERINVLLDPGSAYLIAGASRSQWEHSIPPVSELRYSITFRSLLRKPE